MANLDLLELPVIISEIPSFSKLNRFPTDSNCLVHFSCFILYVSTFSCIVGAPPHLKNLFKSLPSISELPTRLTYFTSRCVLRKCSNFENYNLILVKDLFPLFPSLRIPRCHVGLDDLFTLYHL